MSDGSSRAGYLGPTAYKSLMAIFTRCLTDRGGGYSLNPILFRESRHTMSQLNGDRLYCIDTSLSQHLINDTKHNKCVVGQRLKPST